MTDSELITHADGSTTIQAADPNPPTNALRERDAMLRAMDRTGGRLDAAVVAYRENPTEANRERLLDVQAEHVELFYAEQTGVYIEITRR